MEKPRESGVSRIVEVSPGIEKSLLDVFKSRLERKEKLPLEKEHSPELDELIVGVNEKMKEFLQRFGVESVQISPDNIHCMDKSAVPTKFTIYGGLYFPEGQQIIVFRDYEASKLKFAHTLAHESLHLNSFNSFQISPGSDFSATLSKDGETIAEDFFSLGVRRVGLSIHSPTKGIIHFEDFNEALTEELAIRFDWEYFSSFPMLHEQFEERRREVEESANKSGNSFEQEKRAHLYTTVEKTETGYAATTTGNSYPKEREKLYELITDLYEKNKTSFQAEEEVFALFVTAGFTGRLLPLARLIESTYGKGSFRKLGVKTGKPI